MAGAAFIAVDTTAGAAAPMTQMQLLAATVRARVRGFQMGNTAATAAQGVGFQLNIESTAGTATTITAANTKLDPNSPSPITVATSTFTATATAGTVVGEYGFDIVGTYILWFPPGAEPFVTGTGRLGLRKQIGADSTLWYGGLYWSED